MWELFEPYLPSLKDITDDITEEIQYQHLKHSIKDVYSLIDKLAAKAKIDPLGREFANYLDEHDQLKKFRGEFSIPKAGNIALDGIEVINPDEDSVYLCGNSLGLMPKRTKELVNQELDTWASSGVTGHFKHKYNRPWFSIQETVVMETADLVGAKPIEVTVMNTLTSNLHLLMVSFYTPTKTRFKVMIEDNAFPSDQYAVESQIRFHGYDPATALIKISPPTGEYTLSFDEILKTIEQEGDEIALVIFAGVQYYTGQFFEIRKITQAAQRKGCIVGFDLAHAVGNVVLKLHKWKVDFATWCTYKYMNSGPGGIACIFVHEKHAHDLNRHRFTGWWGSDEKTRFQANKPFQSIPGAGGFQLSNPSVLNVVSLLGSLEIFSKTSMVELRTKSILLTGYLEYLLDKQLNELGFRIITPRNPHQRGCQLSILFDKEKSYSICKELMSYGIVVDSREPNCIRVAPVPLYNTFYDVWRFTRALKMVVNDLKINDEVNYDEEEVLEI